MRQKLIVMLVLTLLGCAGAAEYQVSLLRFDEGRLATSVKTGPGQDKVCQLLFDPPGVYIGPSIIVPDAATPCGGVLVVSGAQQKLLLLRSWTDEAGKAHFACMGPDSVFARQAASLPELLDELAKVFLKP